MNQYFVFELAQKVTLNISGEEGYILGRAEYIEQGKQYQVHYKNSNGNAVTEWFCAGQLTAA